MTTQEPLRLRNIAIADWLLVWSSGSKLFCKSIHNSCGRPRQHHHLLDHRDHLEIHRRSRPHDHRGNHPHQNWHCTSCSLICHWQSVVTWHYPRIVNNRQGNMNHVLFSERYKFAKCNHRVCRSNRLHHRRHLRHHNTGHYCSQNSKREQWSSWHKLRLQRGRTRRGRGVLGGCGSVTGFQVVHT